MKFENPQHTWNTLQVDEEQYQQYVQLKIGLNSTFIKLVFRILMLSLYEMNYTVSGRKTALLNMSK